MNKVLIVLKWDLTILKLKFCESERRLKTKLMNLGSISHLKKNNYKVWTARFWLNYSNVLLELLMEKEQAYMLTKDAKKIK